MSTVSGGRRRAFRSRHRTPMGRGGKLAVIFFSAALLLFVIAVMLGNHLRGLAQQIIDDTTDAASTAEAEVYYANVPPSVIARGVRFGVDYSHSGETAEESEATGTDTSLIEEPVEYDAVSVTLRCKDRAEGGLRLAYSSPVSLEYRIDCVGSTDLDAGLALIKENWGARTTVCGIFEIDYLARPEELREIMRVYEIALVCELVESGIDEILLVGFDDNTEEALAFISDVYGRVGRGTAIGVALSFDYINAPDAKPLINELAKKCGFLALDLYSLEVPALMNAEALIVDRVSRSSELRREFSIRVLLGCGKDPDCDSQTRAAIGAGAKNVMSGVGLPTLAPEDDTEVSTE